jgi:hypothetical protein
MRSVHAHGEQLEVSPNLMWISLHISMLLELTV